MLTNFWKKYSIRCKIMYWFKHASCISSHWSRKNDKYITSFFFEARKYIAESHPSHQVTCGLVRIEAIGIDNNIEKTARKPMLDWTVPHQDCQIHGNTFLNMSYLTEFTPCHSLWWDISNARTRGEWGAQFSDTPIVAPNWATYMFLYAFIPFKHSLSHNACCPLAIPFSMIRNETNYWGNQS